MKEPLIPETQGAGRVGIVAALLIVYLVWGSTYLAMRVGLQGFPPFLMAGVRFGLAGGLLYGALRLAGAPAPGRREWAGALLVGTLLLAAGNGGVVFAEQWVMSGLAALGIATTPLWVALFAGLWGSWPSRREWLGLALGFAGLIVLNLGSDLRASPRGALALLFASAAWALGSVWSRRLVLPAGAMSSATQMLSGGAVLLGLSGVSGERLHALPGLRPSLALAYLVFGAVAGFSAYVYLLRRVRPALATSYAYVNPLVAVGLGALLEGEKITGGSLVALVLILAGVGLVLAPARRPVVTPNRAGE